METLYIDRGRENCRDVVDDVVDEKNSFSKQAFAVKLVLKFLAGQFYKSQNLNLSAFLDETSLKKFLWKDCRSFFKK